MWIHCNFPNYGQFGAIRKPDSRGIPCRTYIFINSNLLSYKNWKQNKKISNTALTISTRIKVLLLKKMLTSAKLRGPWYWNLYFLKPHICVYLHTKVEVSSVILTSFRLGANFISPPQNRPLESPPRSGLIFL